ncbi:amidase [Virgibacillus sp. MG-45]|uniref:amidase n=1 Tax=Virgibacillus sp. MG-45 TaxID=3102791 RepID=UPI002ED89B02
MNENTYLSLDATAMAQLIKQKETTPKELALLAYAQLDKVNDSIHAVTHQRMEQVMKAIANIDPTYAQFSGVPILLKNISQAIEGELLTSGSKLFQHSVAEQDSHFVRKIREAGFSMLGHTNTPEFGLKNITEPKLYGPTRNPWNLAYSPGGSSGGAAAAIAAGVVPLAGASDGGGSIRIPASFSGLFGLKPTRGRTPVGPGTGRQWHGASIDFVLSRTVRDSAALLDVLQVIQPAAAFQTPLYRAGYKQTLEQPLPKKLRIGYTTASPVGTPVSEDAKRAVKKVLHWLEGQGHLVEEVDNGVDGIQLMKDYYLMNSGEIATLVEGLERSLGRSITAEDVEIETWVLNEAGKSVSAAAFSASLASWDVAAANMAAFHETYDFYVTPATAYTAPKIGELTHSPESEALLQKEIATSDTVKKQEVIWDMFLPSLTYTPYTQLANLTGQPAMSVPVYTSEEGLPLGVQFMAPKGMEHQLLQLAYQMEQSDIWVGMKGNPYFEKQQTYHQG